MSFPAVLKLFYILSKINWLMMLFLNIYGCTGSVKHRKHGVVGAALDGGREYLLSPRVEYALLKGWAAFACLGDCD